MSTAAHARPLEPAASAAPPPPDLRSVFGRTASSAWVVTSAQAGRFAGFTAVSIASVSLDPPMISLNINRTSSSLSTVVRSRRLAAHLLDDGQQHLAERYAGDRDRRFVVDGTWSLDQQGVPVVHDAVARLSGDVTDVVDAGDSYVVIAAVSDIELCQRPAQERRPLLRLGRDWCSPFAS